MKKSIGSGRGSVYNILLKALQTGDKYGYEICKEVEEKTNGTYILKQPSLYSGLKRLEAQGEITSYWRDSALGGRRHYYSLTEKGQKRIASSNFSWTDARDNIVDSLFEKSEVEKQIDDVSEKLAEIKSTALENADQKIIDDILQNTEHLANQNNKADEEYAAKEKTTANDVAGQSNDAGDLFSMFSSNNYSTSNQTADIDSDKNTDNLNAVSNDNLYNDENGELVNNTKQINKDDTKEYQSLFTVYSQGKEESTEKAIETDEDKQPDDNLVKDEYTLNDVDYDSDNKNDEQNDEKDNDVSEKVDENDAELNVIESTEKNIVKNNDEDTPNLAHQNPNQTDLFEFLNSNYSQEENKNEQIETKQEDDNPFDDLYHNLQTVYQAEEKTNNLAINANDNTESETDDTESETIEETLEKSNSNILDSYFSTHSQSSKFIDNNKIEKPESVFSNYNDVIFSNHNDINLDYGTENTEKIKETTEKEVDSTISNNTNKDENQNDAIKLVIDNKALEKSTDENVDIIYSEQSTNTQSVNNEMSENNQDLAQSTQTETPTPKLFSYRDIFGDLMSNNSVGTDEIKQETDNNTADNLENQAKYSEDSEVKHNEDSEVKRNEDSSSYDQAITNEIQSENLDSKADELPYREGAVDINQTLMFDKDIANKIYRNSDFFENKQDTYHNSDFESYDQTPFTTDGRNPFEKYNTYVEPAKADIIEKQTIIEHKNNVAFDKKFENDDNKFDVIDYSVRYYKKNLKQSNYSRFISINKLNLITSTILFLLICIATTITIVLTSKYSKLENFQLIIFILGYVVSAIILLIEFIKFMLNKKKKTHKLDGNEKVKNLTMATIIAILALVINIVAGMRFNNFVNYSASFLMPIYYAFALIIKYRLKKWLSSLKTFYN